MPPIIKKWYDTYTRYMKLSNPSMSEEDIDDCWVSLSVGLTEYWQKQESGEVQKLYDSFGDMLRCQIEHYQNLADYWARVSSKLVDAASDKVRKPGNRYLP